MQKVGSVYFDMRYCDVVLVGGTDYSRPSLCLYDASEHTPFLCASYSIDVPITPEMPNNLVAINNHGPNEGIFNELLDAGIVRFHGYAEFSPIIGTVPLCELTTEPRPYHFVCSVVTDHNDWDIYQTVINGIHYIHAMECGSYKVAATLNVHIPGLSTSDGQHYLRDHDNILEELEMSGHIKVLSEIKYPDYVIIKLCEFVDNTEGSIGQVNFCNTLCNVYLESYADSGAPALILKDHSTHERVSVATVNLPNVTPPAGYVFIRNNRENSGIYEALRDAGIVGNASIRSTSAGIVLIAEYLGESP